MLKAPHHLQALILAIAMGLSAISTAQINQTALISPILFNSELPFKVCIQVDHDAQGNPFLLPNGLQGYSIGFYEGQWLILTGRTNGLHGFVPQGDNFPPPDQNRVIYVVDPDGKRAFTRSLQDPSSGLTQDQIDSLSVTSPQYDQVGNTLYITGGYGFRHSLNNYTTFDFLTAIDMPGLIHWVIQQTPGDTAAQHIRQISNPIFQITGGDMHQLGKNKPTLLVVGQDFEGAYESGLVTQVYSEQVRRFNIIDDGVHLSVEILPSKPSVRDPNLRRRDLNVVPSIAKDRHGKLVQELLILSGVFTPTTGIWTIPVRVNADGDSAMANPADACTFKQGMNNYVCPAVGLYSKKTGDMFTILCGGASYAFIQNGVIQLDSEIPFINQVTTVRLDEKRIFLAVLDGQSISGHPIHLCTPGQSAALWFKWNVCSRQWLGGSPI